MVSNNKSFVQTLKASWEKLPIWGKAVVLTIGVLILLTFTKPAPEVKPKKEQVWLIDTQFAEPASLSPHLRLLGTLESPADSTISASISASVNQILVKEGAHVQPGKVLVLLEPSEVLLTYTQKEAEHAEILAKIETEKLKHQSNQKALKIEKDLLALSEKSVARFKQLGKNQLSSQKQLDQAIESLQRQRLNVNAKELAIKDHVNQLAQLQALERKTGALNNRALIDLEKSQVLAPFSGRISSIHVAPGENVSRGTALVSMFDTSSLQIRAQIPNRHLPHIKKSLNPHTDTPDPVFFEVKSSFPDFFNGLLARKNTSADCSFITGFNLPQISFLNEAIDEVLKEKETGKSQSDFIHRKTATNVLKKHSLSASGQLPSKRLPLTLSRLSGSVGMGRGGIDGLFDVTGNHDELELGVTIEIIVTLAKEPNSFILPPSALHGFNRIYRVQNNRLLTVEVERLGDVYSEFGDTLGILVRSAQIQAGDKIMVTHLPLAIDGLKVAETLTRCY